MELTLSELIDRLTIVNIKCYNQVEIVNSLSLGEDDEALAKAGKLAHELNKERSKLKKAIDELFHGRSSEIKVYKNEQ